MLIEVDSIFSEDILPCESIDIASLERKLYCQIRVFSSIGIDGWVHLRIPICSISDAFGEWILQTGRAVSHSWRNIIFLLRETNSSYIWEFSPLAEPSRSYRDYFEHSRQPGHGTRHHLELRGLLSFALGSDKNNNESFYRTQVYLGSDLYIASLLAP